jgi:UDP-N-acetylmuramate dehydrogenase
MFEIKENISLKNYNTFGIDVQCRYFVNCSSTDDLIGFFKSHGDEALPIFILGGGSNVLFTQNYEGYILHLNSKGIEVLKKTSDDVYIKASAGEDWDEFVGFCVDNNWGGVENLSLIPGNVGTCPIQNIGAYGVEVKDVIDEVETIEIKTLKKHRFTNSECEFGYRDSIFKRKLKGEHIITNVTFKLKIVPDFKLDYGNLRDGLKRFEKVDLRSVRQSVINIRNSKLPKPEEIGNSGSFFKNPVVDSLKAQKIKEEHLEMPSYQQGNGMVKIPAGWLIETAGWKGKRIGDAGVHERQALVLVNYGNASGKEILSLANKIKQSVKEQFDIELEMEVNIV